MLGGGARDSRRTLLSKSAAHSSNGSNREGRGSCLGFLVYLFCGLLSSIKKICGSVYVNKLVTIHVPLTDWTLVHILHERWGFLRSAKRCHHCILGLMCSANLKLDSQNLMHCSVYTVQCIVYSPQLCGGGGCMTNSGALAWSRQNTASPKYIDGTWSDNTSSFALYTVCNSAILEKRRIAPIGSDGTCEENKEE
jgi:hypothetical protein